VRVERAEAARYSDHNQTEIIELKPFGVGRLDLVEKGNEPFCPLVIVRLVIVRRCRREVSVENRIAIVAIHGVIPHPRYGFQDEVATALRDRLNGFTGEGAPAPTHPRRRGAGRRGDSEFRGAEEGQWRTDIVFPEVAQSPATGTDAVAAERPSIIRVHLGEDDVLHPKGVILRRH
jgi:hypothetical protein